MDWSQFPEQVMLAAMIVGVFNVAVSGFLELIKQIAGLFGKEITPGDMTVITGVVSAGLVAYAMVDQGTAWPIAVLAVVAAVYGPKVAHDAVTKLKPERKVQ